MAMTTAELIEAVCAKFKEEDAGWVEGPHHIGEHEISRVWTKDDDGEYHAHYAVETGANVRIFEDFGPFASWLAYHFDLDHAARRRLELIRTLIASAVILAAMAMVGFLVVQNPAGAFPIAYVLTTIVGGGAGYLFAIQHRNDKA